jgi:hypothetical protein
VLDVRDRVGLLSVGTAVVVVVDILVVVVTLEAVA